ncbi:MAG TPA: pteridine reductase [Gammaproteobacteria bacterium]|nr:pteridine reductase [Gammaproteobacteria bacterium]
MSISPKVFLITGAARRVGAEIAETLHKNGFNVVLHYHHSKEEARHLCAALNDRRKNSAVRLQADLSHIKQMDKLINQAVDAWGYLDGLVNNASQFYKTLSGKSTEKSWDDLLDTNLKSPFFLSQAAAKYLKERRGCIVNIGDVHGERPMRDYGVYCISKAGLLMLTKVLAKELAPEIRVNTVSPGSVMLPEGENTLTKSQQEAILNRVALKRNGTAGDIAKAVLYLAADADYVTGTVLTVDGGRSLSI